MPEKKRTGKWQNWKTKLRNKYRLVILNDESYEERLSFRLSRLNVFISIGITVIILISLTILLIAYTPLREYIPGYTDVTLSKRVNTLLRKTDSLEIITRQKSMYIKNIKQIIGGGYNTNDSIDLNENSEAINFKDKGNKHSETDSLLRSEYEQNSSYDLFYNENQELSRVAASPSSFTLFNPLKGIITSEFDLAEQHYGIDIVSKETEAGKATLDGTVILANWTVETGYEIAIQHQGRFISVYKHNAVLLKKHGDFVKAGDPIAIVGESGELTTGTHLHFELWNNGTPVNPREYIVF